MSSGILYGWPLIAGQATASTAPVLLPLGPLTASFNVGSTAGTLITTITGLSAGESITSVTPNDGRIAVSNGSAIVVGLTASSAGSISYTYTTNLGRTFVQTISANAVTSALQSIRADGWSGDYGSTPPTFTPNTNPVTFPITRQGFTNTGAATTYTETVTITQRVRQPVNSATVLNNYTLDPTRVALSTVIYSTDILPNGMTNNSTEASPPPIIKWARPPHSTVGNSIRLEVVSMHRNAKAREPLSCVIFSASDGTNTVTQTVSISTVLGHSGDLNAVTGYGATLDISSLNNGTITTNFKAYPIAGGTSAIVDSSTGAADGRDASPQKHRKDPTKVSTPPYAYVSPTGVDATGVVSTTAATAAATPFLTLQGARNGLLAATGLTGGIADGCVIRISGDVNWSATSTGAFTQGDGALYIERDPNVARSAAIIRFGAANYNLGLKHLWYRDVSLVRTNFFLGTTGSTTTAASACVLENVNFDNGNVDAAPWASNAFTAGYVMGCAVTNGKSTLFGTGATETRLSRGISMTGTNLAVDGQCLLGCNFSGVGVAFANGRVSNSVLGFNKFMSITQTWMNVGSAAAVGTINGLAIVQNVIEWIVTTDQPSYRVSSDTGYSDTVHVCSVNNTTVGHKGLGRTNYLYDDTTDKFRSHRLSMMRGDIHNQLNVKSDIFVRFFTAFPNPELHVNGWSHAYGVDSESVISVFGNVIDHVPNGTPGQAACQEFPGLYALCGGNPDEAAPNNVPIDVKYTAFAGTVSSTVAGAGGGVYTIQSGSPAIGLLKNPAVRFGLDGTPRGIPSASGAYAASAGN